MGPTGEAENIWGKKSLLCMKTFGAEIILGNEIIWGLAENIWGLRGRRKSYGIKIFGGGGHLDMKHLWDERAN